MWLVIIILSIGEVLCNLIKNDTDKLIDDWCKEMKDTEERKKEHE